MNKQTYSKVTIFLCCLLFFNKNIFGSTGGSWFDKIDSVVLQEVKTKGKADFLVIFQEQADVSSAYTLKGKVKKGELVYNKLSTVAARAQGKARAILESSGTQHVPFYIVNAIAVSQGDWSLLEKLAPLPEVQSIMNDPWVYFEEPAIDRQETVLSLREGVEWGLQKVGADQVWMMGYTGQGAIVGGADTGVEWDHPAIVGNYRGKSNGNIQHEYNWHDAVKELSPLNRDSVLNPANNPCGLQSQVPCDDHSHGTHTVGTMVGDDHLGNQVGMAPGATWIGCRNMERGWGKPSTYIECFQWFLAPTDADNQNPKPSLAPHVINNSWGCPEEEGCNAGNWEVMRKVVANLKAAGIFIAVSAGNSGPSCSSIDNPAAIFEESFSVGASNIRDSISGFSSRGPIAVDSSGRVKPNVVAPGSGVRSAVKGGGYQTWNGTSMAGPHVAGLVALLISANPSLAGEVETLEEIIEETAVQLKTNQVCNGLNADNTPNNTYGYGRIDALTALSRAITTDTNNASKVFEIKAFPNPFSGMVTFRWKGLEGRVVIEIFNGTGQLVAAKSFTSIGTGSEEVDLDGRPSGMYWYRITNGKTVLSGKVVKK